MMQMPKNPTSSDVFLMMASSEQKKAAFAYKMAERFMEIANSPEEADAILRHHEDERLAHNRELARRRREKKRAK